MQKPDTTQNLLFLLSLAPLSFGCVIATDDDDTDGNNSTDGGQTTTTGDDDDDDDDDDMDTTAGTDEGTTAGTAGTGNDDVCAAYLETVTYCYNEKQGVAGYEYCLEQVAYFEPYGKECLGAFEDFTACLSALTCEEFEDPQACPDEVAAFEAACFGEETGGSSSGTGGGSSSGTGGGSSAGTGGGSSAGTGGG